MESTMKRTLIYFLLFTMACVESKANLRTVYQSTLDRETAMIGQWHNREGLFIAGKGWQAIKANSQLMIALPKPLAEEGALIVNLSNFDPVSQNISEKQQIINLYSQDNGSKAIFNTSGSWINIRTGTNYSTGPGKAGFKMLAAPCGINSRDEVRIMEDATWDLQRSYEFKIMWDKSSVTCYLDGVKCYTLPFKGQVEPFKYIFLGTDNVYCAQPGIIFSNLRLLAPLDSNVAQKEENILQTPAEPYLYQNYPNPFNPTTTIMFYLPETQAVRLEIFDLQGKGVAQLLDAVVAAGRHEIIWEGSDNSGHRVASGVYWYRLQAGKTIKSNKMVIAK